MLTLIRIPQEADRALVLNLNQVVLIQQFGEDALLVEFASGQRVALSEDEARRLMEALTRLSARGGLVYHKA